MKSIANDKSKFLTKVKKDPIAMYLNASKIITILLIALLFLPWVSLSVRDGYKSSYFLFEFRRFFQNVTEYTGADQFDYSVLLFIIPVLMFLISLPVLFKFWFLTVKKLSYKNTYLAMKRYCQVMMFSGCLFIFVELVMTYVARNEILVKKVPYGYNPVVITVVPVVMCILSFLGFLCNRRYYIECCYENKLEYVIEPKDYEPMSYMKKTTFYQCITFLFYLLTIVPMVLREICLVNFVFGKESKGLNQWVGGLLYESTNDSSNVRTIQVVLAVITGVIFLLGIHAILRYLIELVSRKNRFNIAVAFCNTMGIMLLSSGATIVGIWIIKLFGRFNLCGLTKDLVAGITIPVLVLTTFIISFVGYFFIAKIYQVELCCEQDIPIHLMSRKYNQNIKNQDR